MPIEVKELHIRVVVQEPSKDSSAAGDAVPTNQFSLNFAQIEFQSIEGGGDFLFQADADASGGRDVLIGGAGADHIDAAAITSHLLFDGFDLV